jgi:hypothetical protein
MAHMFSEPSCTNIGVVCLTVAGLSEVCAPGRMVSLFILERGVCRGGHQTVLHWLILAGRPHLLTIKHNAAGPPQIRYGTKPACAT